MAEHKFKLGDIVRLNPTGANAGAVGKVIARIEFIDGARGYIVSAWSHVQCAIVRHVLTEYEIVLDEPAA